MSIRLDHGEDALGEIHGLAADCTDPAR